MKTIIKGERVRVEEAPRRRVQPARRSRECEKAVQLHRVDGQVRALEVRCSCGDVTVVELEYDETPGAESPR